MSTIFKEITGHFKNLSESAVLTLVGVVLLAITLLITFVVDNGYTTARTVDATVTAKVHGGAQGRSGTSPYFMLAVRHADGTEQDVRTNFVTYSKAAVGSTTQVTVSDYTLGREMSLKSMLVLGVLILSMAGSTVAFFGAMVMSPRLNTIQGMSPSHA